MARPDDSPLDVAPTRLRIGAAAASLGVSVDTLRRWEKEGRIRFERVGNQRVISSEEITRWLPTRSKRMRPSFSQRRSVSTLTPRLAAAAPMRSRVGATSSGLSSAWATACQA